MTRLITWNVNGLRACDRKGFRKFVEAERPDILCLQEVKALPEQLPPKLRAPAGYHVTWNPAKRKGYSGVATWTREAPKRVSTTLGIPSFDAEGRVVITELAGLTVFNVYFPNGGQGPHRVKYKLEFTAALLSYAQALRAQGQRVLICGDFNTAHEEIDLARPKQNVQTSGFMPEERVWITEFIEAGYTDSFRAFHEEGERYTWWSYRAGARERNVGWRIDYVMVDAELRPSLKGCDHLDAVEGSDHCPVRAELELD